MTEISNNPTAEGTNAWTNPSNGRTSNDVYATAAPGKNLSVSGIWKTFGITDPGNGAVITKVEIGHEHKVSTTSSVATLGRQVSWDDGTTWSTEDILSTALTEVLVDTIYWLDVTAATSWTWAKLALVNTRIRAIQGNSSTAVTFSLDANWIRVTYTVPTEAYATEAILDYKAPTEAYAAEAILDYKAPTEVYAAETILAYMAPTEAYATETILDYAPSTLPCEAYAAEAILNYEFPACEAYATEAILNYLAPTEVYAAETILDYAIPPCEAYAAEALLAYIAPTEVYATEIILNYEVNPCEAYATEVILDYAPAVELVPCEVYAAESILNYIPFAECEVYAAEAILDYELPPPEPCEIYAAEVILDYVDPDNTIWFGWQGYWFNTHPTDHCHKRHVIQKGKLARTETYRWPYQKYEW